MVNIRNTELSVIANSNSLLVAKLGCDWLSIFALLSCDWLIVAILICDWLQAYKRQFMSNFQSAQSEDAGFNPNSKIIQQEEPAPPGTARRKKSRWE